MKSSDIHALLNTRKIHWAVKAQLLNNFIKKNSLTHEAAAYDIAVDIGVIREYMSLANYAQKYSALTKVPTKRSALSLIEKYGENPPALRAEIQLAIIRNKTQLEMEEIKSRFKTKKESE